MITSNTLDRSPTMSLVGEIKRLLGLGREHALSHVRREQNKTSHVLCQMGRAGPRTAVWLRFGPPEIADLC